MENAARGAREAGVNRITLGKAEGYYKEDTAFLFVDCFAKDDEEKTLVEVDVTYEKTTDRAVIQNMASLAAETLRLGAREVWDCESADALPNGSPQVG
ncbi:hypothetical protein M2271_001545 [Streptomyces sp. LBL]|uniref:hypothetical protein n=1 Tax=Streptomyces sp. LBL TaxID=2940562 RepID=UPI0024767AB5|nr:hypothetical protein [Streptomyces sp. LBL]MDH6623753.1 hypothetical protein [Streptomyces sp. LBL]